MVSEQQGIGVGDGEFDMAAGNGVGLYEYPNTETLVARCTAGRELTLVPRHPRREIAR